MADAMRAPLPARQHDVRGAVTLLSKDVAATRLKSDRGQSDAGDTIEANLNQHIASCLRSL